jgi:ATP-dependent Clp protease ATP-binding subunit ClpC
MKTARIGKTSYVWDEPMDATARALKKTRDSMGTAINMVSLVAAVLSFVVFAYAALIATPITQTFSWSFWQRPSSAGFFLSLTALIAAFLYYRITEAARQKTLMPKVAAGPASMEEYSAGPKVNVASLFEKDAIKSVEEAYDLAEKYGHSTIEPLHLFIGSLVADDVAIVFGRLGLTFDMLKESLGRRLQSVPTGKPAELSAGGEETLLAAFVNAFDQGRAAVSALEIFYEAYKRDEFIRELLYDKKVDDKRLGNVVEWIRITGKLRERYDTFRRAAFFKPTGAMNRAMTSVATPHVDAYCDDLTTAAVNNRLPLLIGRDQEMEELLRIIEGGRQSVVLVGPEGVGKTAILSGVAERMVNETVPAILQDKRLVSLSIPAIVSGATPSAAQERLMSVLVEISRARNIVLVIPNIEQMTGLTPGGEQTADLSALLADALSRGITFAIATTTPQAYAANVERSVLGRVFEKVNVPEPDTNTAIRILESKIGGIEYEMNVIFSYEAVEKAVELSDRYMHEAYLPKKAIEVCREVALQVGKTRGKNALVTGEDVSGIVSQKTGIPVTSVAEEEKDKLLHLEERMHGRVIGQEEAVKAVAAALRRARAELRAENRPIANFLFLGPTGVGKTELAKTVAETYFGSEDAMLRFDMSEYQDSASIYRLIGTPGSTQGGLMTEAVRRNPFSIVLLDELEKAHPDILNVFLQVFDDGRLTDSAGRTIDFTNTIIVATSNAGTQYIQDEVAKGTALEQIKSHLLEQELRGIYRPEFLNRFDGIIVFKPLTPDDVQQIAYLMIDQVGKRLEPKGIHFRATDEAVMELAKKGYDPKFGARPLRRVIQEEVDNAIAKALLEGQVRRRDTIVLKPGGEIDIEKAPEL